MCFDPVSIALAVATTATSAMGAMAENQQRQQAYDASVRTYNQNYANALAAGRDSQRQLTQRQIQEQAAYGQKDRVQAVQGAEKSAEASAASAGTGVSGLSVDNIIADVGRKVGANRATLQTNWENTAAQLQTQQDATVNQTQSNINRVATPSESPDSTGTGLQIIGAGLKSFASLKPSLSF